MTFENILVHYRKRIDTSGMRVQSYTNSRDHDVRYTSCVCLADKRPALYAQWVKINANVASRRLKNNTASVHFNWNCNECLFDALFFFGISISCGESQQGSAIGGLYNLMSVELPVTCRLCHCGEGSDQSRCITYWRNWVCLSGHIQIVRLKWDVLLDCDWLSATTDNRLSGT